MNLKMTVERSKCRSYFLSLVFITKCLTKNLLHLNYLHTNNKNNRIRLFLLFVRKYLAFYFLFHCFRNCKNAEFFIHELELENDRGAVETSFLFLIACFHNKAIDISTKSQVLEFWNTIPNPLNWLET